MKTCTECGQIKTPSEFSKYNNMCKQCRYKRGRIWIKNHPDKVRAAQKKWEDSNREKENIRKNKWNITHPECLNKWKKENPEKLKEYARKWAAKNRLTSKGKLSANIKTAIWISLKGSKAGRHWEDLVGYTVDQLKEHLEKQFLPSMTWENYGKWHIDHRIPISAFNFETPEDIDFKQCWALRNLRPLWAKDNLKKRTKLEKPFQPSLLIREEI
jgi:hypothetical protein